MKQIVQAFSLGLLTATILLSTTYYLTKDNQVNDEHKVIDNQTMITELESQGYVVNKLEKDKENNKKDEEDSEQQDLKSETVSPEENIIEEKDKATEPVIEYTLSIEPGMNSLNVVSALATAGIIKDTESFNQYLEQNGYSTLIQVGNYKVTSKMSFQQLAETITN